MIEATYEYLRSMPPFRRWKLPPGNKIKFRVSNSDGNAGLHEVYSNGDQVLSVSGKRVGHLNLVIQTVAHEMVHVYHHKLKLKAAHGADFRRHAALICRKMGFDPKAF
jgi:hypothetical protein